MSRRKPPRPGPEKWPEKAYKNLDFLTSADARAIRVLCEFVEPQARFRKQGVRDTVVFFGSARTPDPEKAQERYDELLRVRAHGDHSEELDREVAQAEHALKLSSYYRDADELAERLTHWARALPNKQYRFVVCSGGGAGIMEAANRGALRAGGKSVSLNISLPHEQLANPYQTRELAFEFHYFFVRKFWFIYLAKALVVFPGGYGTLDELFEVLTLIQTNKTRKHMPVVMYGSEYWDSLMRFETLVEWGMIDAEDLKLFKVCSTVDEAFDHLTSELTRIYL